MLGGARAARSRVLFGLGIDAPLDELAEAVTVDPSLAAGEAS